MGIFSNLNHNFNEYIWPGLGLYGESYILFSIGTIRPIWDILYPQCFSAVTCSNALLSSLTYTVVTGIILGMVIIGTIGGSRRNGSIATSALMLVGSLGMTFSAFIFKKDPQLMLKNLVTFLFIFGIGVGGEYPLSASSASERAMSEMKTRLHKEQLEGNQNNEGLLMSGSDEFNVLKEGRGKRVVLVFSMQGMGILVNSLTLTFLLFVLGEWGNNDDGDYYQYEEGDDAYYQKIVGNYNRNNLIVIWQTIYAIGSMTLLYVLISRLIYLKESAVWAEDNEKRQHIKKMDQDQYYPPLDEHTYIEYDDLGDKEIGSAFEFVETKLLFKHYGHRLFGTSISWLLWDVAFYGNKMFQSTFLYALTGQEATLFQISGVAFLNALVSLMGYYAAAALIDRPSVGRLKLQQYGFLITGSLFCLCGFLRESVSTVWLIVMYFGSSFFGQCGPNCTTFLIPAEIFPTEMRTMCHGVSAAAGKVGALLAAIMFNYLSESGMFLFSGYCSFLAFFITFMTIPESSTLDLHELDKKWRKILKGELNDYRGSADEFRHMSVWERWSLNRS